ncbi:major facilitator superfamily domain-containing protein [Dendryphion nanum]|uniref:Major facilitator superfamily domain-containing protein n=1 Tax=Dendryphion nanum TaxID=256645 RepID=A0A9P9DKY0_9PLEO|nr:major facilitator superfamily domain-containing protein [Dendryphion nanum]
MVRVEVVVVRDFRTAKAHAILGIEDNLPPEPPPKPVFESRRLLTDSSWDDIDLKQEESFPKQDEGLPAWIFLLGVSVVEAVSWSFPACFGVFREYYLVHPPFEGVTILAVIGVLSDGCLQMLMPLLLLFLKRFPRFNKPMMWVGLVLCVVASLGASISTKPWQIIATQGALYGVGAGCLTAPIIVFMSEWFDKRQSFAYGVMFGASGLFGSFLPTVYTKLLHTYGQKITLICHGGGVLVLTTSALLCIGHRTPLEHKLPATAAQTYQRYDFWKKVSFYLLGFSVFVQAVVLNLPAIFLPSFVTELNFTPTQGAIALSMFNLATASGQVGFGLFADHRNSFYSTVFLSTAISGLASLFLWGEAKTLTASIIFAFGHTTNNPILLVYGISSGGYGILRSRFASTVVGDKNEKEQILLVLGLFTATRGAGNVAGGFLGERLVDENVHVKLTAYGLEKWMPLVLCVGVGMLVAGLMAVAQYLNHSLERKRKRRKRMDRRRWPDKGGYRQIDVVV